MTIGQDLQADPAVLVCNHLVDRDDPSIGCDLIPIANLCGSPQGITDAATGHTRVIVISCDRGPSLAETQGALIKAQIDLGTSYIQHITEPVSASNLDSLIRGCVARVAGQRRLLPAVWKSDVSQGLSRRNLLRIQAPEKVPLPWIDHAGCVFAEGCRACIDVCPSSAVTIDNSGTTIDQARCTTCGLCEPACPTAAIIDVAVTSSSISAQVTAFLDRSDETTTGPHGISFVCRHAPAISLEEGWWPVRVTSLGVVTAAWLLAPLLMGSAGVSVPRCDVCEGYVDVAARVALAQQVVAALGWDDRTISRRGSVPDLQPAQRTDLVDPFGSHGAVEVFASIAERTQANFRWDDDESPVGQVAIGDACTGSFLCASVCPTDALTATDMAGGVEVRFDASLCTGCRHCLDVCPEVQRGAIRVSREIDFEALRAGPGTLRTHVSAVCESCGAPLEATQMLTRVMEMLQQSDDRAIADGLHKCPKCLEASVVAAGRAFLQ